MSEVDSHGTGAGLEPLISELVSEEDIVELVEYFISELHGRIVSILNSFENGEFEQLRTLAHQLKGAGTGYGFPSITETAGELEKSLLNQEADTSALQEKVEALVLLCRRACLGGG